MRNIIWHLLVLLLFLGGCDNNGDNGSEGTGDESTGDENPGDPPNDDPPPSGDPVPLSEDHRVLAVFTSDNDLDDLRDLFVVARSGRMKNLSHPIEHVVLFAVSPDNRWVAFASATGLYVTPIHEPDMVEVTPAGNYEIVELAWKPDSSQIALRARLDGGPQKGYVVGRDGSGFTDIGGPVGEVITRLLWSGDLLAFHSDQVNAGQHEVYVWNGTSAQRISFVTAPPGTPRFVRFSWSPTEGCLSFLAEGELYVWDGTDTTRVSDAPGITGDSWVWNGDEIVYPRDGALYVVSKTGGDARKISGDLTVEDFAVSPDGALVAFLVDDRQLYVTEGTPVLVAEALGLIRDFKWSNNSDAIAYRATDVVPPPLLPDLQLYSADATGVIPAEMITSDNVIAYGWVESPPQLASRATANEDAYWVNRGGNYASEFGGLRSVGESSYATFQDTTLHFGQDFGRSDGDVVVSVDDCFVGGQNRSYTTSKIDFVSPRLSAWIGPTCHLGNNVRDVQVVDGLVPTLVALGGTTLYGTYVGRYEGFGDDEGISFERFLALAAEFGAFKVAGAEHDDRGLGFNNRYRATADDDLALGFDLIVPEIDGTAALRMLLGPGAEWLNDIEVEFYPDADDQTSGYTVDLTLLKIRGNATFAFTRLRAGAHADSPIRDTLAVEQQFEIVGRHENTEDWYLVRLGDGNEGWINRNRITLLGGATHDDIILTFGDDYELADPADS